MRYSRERLQALSDRYDEDYPWWVETENELGEKIRVEKYLDKETLRLLVDWKFRTLKGRRKRTYNLLEKTSDREIRAITRKALEYSIMEEDARIDGLRQIKGIGISMASVILSFYDPLNYGVYDIHVVRQLYGVEPKYMFTYTVHYLNMLRDLRKIRDETGLRVRDIEKALFLLNLEGSTLR